MNFKVGDHIVIVGVPTYSDSQYGQYKDGDTGIIREIDKWRHIYVDFDTPDEEGDPRQHYTVDASEAEHSDLHNSPLWKALG